MTDKAVLIDWIHRVEFDLKENRPTKRRPSLVTELYFERVLVNAPALELPLHIVAGWLRHFNRNNNRTEWIKIASGDSPEKKLISHRFIREMAAHYPDDRFFLLKHNVETVLGSAVPTVSLRIEQILDGRTSQSRSELTRSDNINRRIQAELDSRKSIDAGDDLAEFLDKFPIEDLAKLFAARCLMNFGGLHPTDVDGIGVSRDNHLMLIEFKRKDPAKGIRYRLRNNGDLLSYQREIRQLKSNPKTARNELENTKKWIHARDDCFGLDTSHASNVAICHENKWTYRYVIWDQPPAHPDELFNKDLTLKNQPEILILDVEPHHFDGISMTYGDKSGSYGDGKRRYQLMIKRSNFHRTTKSN